MKLKALDPFLYTPEIKGLEVAEHYASRLFRFINDSVEPPFTISINGRWGTGKTTIMKMVYDKFDGTFPVFWFNPWEYSKSQDVVLSFLQSLSGAHTTALNELNKSGGKIFKVLLNAGLDAALKVTTNGTFSIADIKSALSEAEDESTIDTFKNIIQEIKDDFVDLIGTISKQNNDNPVIIFLDDLDRCLPDDAIALLEALKNLFIVPNAKCIFVCGVDTDIAKRFIMEHYKGIDDSFAHNYFKKIFNLTVSMPHNILMNVSLLEYIKKLNFLYTKQSENFADLIYNCGLKANIWGIREYLNIVHNLVLFKEFNPEFDFEKDGEFLIKLLVLKESWQSIYDDLIRDSFVSGYKLSVVVNRIMARRNVTEIQKEFLVDELGSGSPHHDVALKIFLEQNTTLG